MPLMFFTLLSSSIRHEHSREGDVVCDHYVRKAFFLKAVTTSVTLTTYESILTTCEYILPTCECIQTTLRSILTISESILTTDKSMRVPCNVLASTCESMAHDTNVTQE